MARNLRPMPYYGSTASKKPITIGSFQSATLVAGNEITVYADEVPADKLYTWGYGSTSRDAAETSFIYADFRAGGGGSGSADDELTGEVVLAVTDSTQDDVLARRSIGSIEDLRESQGESLSEKLMLPEHRPPAGQDRHLEIRIKADGNSDGKEFDPTAASAECQFYFGSVSR